MINVSNMQVKVTPNNQNSTKICWKSRYKIAAVGINKKKIKRHQEILIPESIAI